jgi:hypothetical protein
MSELNNTAIQGILALVFWYGIILSVLSVLIYRKLCSITKHLYRDSDNNTRDGDNGISSNDK